MQRTIRTVILAALATLAGSRAGEARAQVAYGVGDPAAAVGMPIARGPTLSVSAPAPVVFEAPAAPYSYFAAFPEPARHYVPYGPMDEFAYGGRPYGHVYDRWSWGYLAGSSDRLNRYYYPPVR